MSHSPKARVDEARVQAIVPAAPRLVAYVTGEPAPQLRCAPAARAWMDATPHSFAYRCLPLTVANSHGWEILNSEPFEAWWDGGAEPGGVRVIVPGGGRHPMALGHFGSGILTFHLRVLFRTEPQGALMVGGPVNRPKDGIQALSGIVETGWSPYGFTMNWLFTRPNHVVRFAAEEPICSLFPVSLAAIEAVAPEIRSIDEVPDLARTHRDWHLGRNRFNEGLRRGEPATVAEKWQKTYYRGLMPDGSRTPATHRQKLRLQPFADRRRPASDGGGDGGEAV